MVKKQQFILGGTGIILLLVLYFFGQTVPPKKKMAANADSGSTRIIGVQDILQASKARLNTSQLAYVNRLENAVVRGDVKNQQLAAYKQLAGFWRDSVPEGFLPYAYYNGESAKLENSEKNLTFAAQLFLENLRGQEEMGLKSWMADQAKGLFERALQLNPDNDSSKVGLGACYIFGSTAENPQEVMQGIQRILEVARRDSSNMYAQFMLGLGGIQSGQLERAIERLTTVVQHQPHNIEAMLTLAQVNQQKGNRAEAIKWYSISRKMIVDPALLTEIDKRIKLLQ
jgi:tetratricopeptide (TPR) repeat protein